MRGNHMKTIVFCKFLGRLRPYWGRLETIFGPLEAPKWAQDGPKDGSKIELKRGRGVKNRILTLLNQSRRLLDAKMQKDEVQDKCKGVNVQKS